MDIEEDIKKVKELNNLLKFFKTHGWIPNLSRNTNINETIKAIERILAEREEDKKRIERLQVLEDDLKDKRIVYVDTPEFAENYIPKQKVKDKFNKLITRIKEFKEPERKKYFSIEQIIDLLEQFENKLLEDK
jgi:ribosomal protein S8